jgi:hypothetical protein
MSDISSTFTIQQNKITVSIADNNVSFNPETIKLNLFTNGPYSSNIPAAGNTGELQFNSGGYLAPITTITYDSSTHVANLGTTQNISIIGGTDGQVLKTDGFGNLSWTNYVANAGYTPLSNHSSFSDLATSANTANYATRAGTSGSANISYGLNAPLGNITIGGGSNGQYLQTNGNGVMSWADVNVVTALANLTDANIVSPVDGQLLSYDAASSKWIASFPGSVTGVTKIVAGTGVTLSPTSGVGTVTITASGGGSGGGNYPTGGGTDKIFWENDATITTNYTVATGKNSMSIGPVAIATGVTVTISPGSVWAII